MPLSPLTRLGPYEIIAAIGAGGMGEVYSARVSSASRASGAPPRVQATSVVCALLVKLKYADFWGTP
jgi:hypothetical protein